MKALVAGVCFGLIGVVGCGGGGGIPGDSATGTAVHFSVQWGARSRAIDGPSSALSMVLRMPGAGAPSGDFTFTVNRDSNLAAHTSAYVSTTKAVAGNHIVTATFYAGADATGSVVGLAADDMVVMADGTLSGTISTVGTVASVEIPTGQTVAVGETKQLDFTAKDAGGVLVAVSPGSASWSVGSGNDRLTFEGGLAKGLAAGSAQVSATVDGKTSPLTTVNVTTAEVVEVKIQPEAPVVAPNGTRQFTATVTGSSNTAVTWKVLTTGGGSISDAGLYTAPATVMYATVEARSAADPTKAATAQVTVQSATINVKVDPSNPTVAPNATKQFTATVEGSPNQAVTWSVVEANGGSVSETGLYSAPATAGGPFHVKATSAADPGRSGTATVFTTPTVYEFVRKWGSFGLTDHDFYWPIGIGVDSLGFAYVAQRSCVQRFTTGGLFDSVFCPNGTPEGSVLVPYGLATDTDNNVYVADLGNFRIQKLSSSGQFLTAWGSQGPGEGQFQGVYGIAADNQGYVYATDYANRVEKFTKDGLFVKQWGSTGAGDGQFDYPVGIAADTFGNVYVVDQKNHRIQKFTADGQFVTKWGPGQGNGDGQFNHPAAVAVDSQGCVYVVDLNCRVQKFTSDGTFLAKFGSYGSGDGQLYNPMGIAIDAAGYVYISENEGQRVSVFRPKFGH